jgi:hypothetical protein
VVLPLASCMGSEAEVTLSVFVADTLRRERLSRLATASNTLIVAFVKRIRCRKCGSQSMMRNVSLSNGLTHTG